MSYVIWKTKRVGIGAPLALAGIFFLSACGLSPRDGLARITGSGDGSNSQEQPSAGSEDNSSSGGSEESSNPPASNNPLDPAGWVLSSPSNASFSSDVSPQISANGISDEEGSSAFVYDDAACSNQVGSASISSGSFVISNIAYANDGSDDGSNAFYGKIVDSDLNESNCSDLSLSYTLDTQAPAAPSGWSLASPSDASTSNDVSPQISGSGLSDTANVRIFVDVACSNQIGSASVGGGSFTVSNISYANDGSDDGSIAFYGSTQDQAGNSSACSDLSLGYTLDTTAAILASATIGNANPTNSTTYNLSYGSVTHSYDEYCILENDTDEGNCSYISGSLPSSFNVSSTQNAKVLSFWLKDSVGNISSRVDSNSVSLDTDAPTSPTISIAGGGSYTQSSSVSLTLSASGADQMYITNTAGCSADGSWESYATSKASWTLGQSNNTATVYVKFRDSALNESSCVSDTIVHDGVAPSAIASIDDGSTSNSLTVSPPISWSSSSDSGSGLNRYEYSLGSSAGATDVRGWTSAGLSTSVTANNLSLNDGNTYYANVRAVDFAGNISDVINGDGWLTDNQASTVNSVVTVDYPTVGLGDTITITLQAKDSSGDPLSSGGLDVAFTVDTDGSSQGSIGSVTDHGDGTYSALFTATAVGTAVTMQATIDGEEVTSVMPTVTVIKGPQTYASGLKSWWKANAISGLSDAANVSTWEDSQNNFDLSEGNADFQPKFYSNVVNGHPAVRFDEAGEDANFGDGLRCDALAVDAQSWDSLSVFYVVKSNLVADRGYLLTFDQSSDPSDILRFGFIDTYDPSDARLRITADNSHENSSAVTADSWAIYASNITANTVDMWQNSSSVISASGTSVALPNVDICAVGYQFNNGMVRNDFLHADIAEIIVYDYDLSTAERHDMEDYLSSKYNITLNR